MLSCVLPNGFVTDWLVVDCCDGTEPNILAVGGFDCVLPNGLKVGADPLLVCWF